MNIDSTIFFSTELKIDDKMEKLSDYPNAKLHDVRLPYPFSGYALVIPDKYNQMIVNLKTGKSPKYRVGQHGYKRIHITDDNGKSKCVKIHRLVAMVICGKELPKGLYVLHLDETRDNNSVSNLGLGTQTENMAFPEYKKRMRNLNTGKLNPCYGKRGDETKKPVKAISIEDGTEITFTSICEAGRNGFTAPKICECLKGKQKTHKGYFWKYL